MSSDTLILLIAFSAGAGAAITYFTICGLCVFVDARLLFGVTLITLGLVIFGACIELGVRPTPSARNPESEVSRLDHQKRVEAWEAYPIHIPYWLWPLGLGSFVVGIGVAGVRIDKFVSPHKYT